MEGDIYYKRDFVFLNEEGNINSKSYTVEITTGGGFYSKTINIRIYKYDDDYSLINYEFEWLQYAIKEEFQKKYTSSCLTDNQIFLYFVQEVLETITELVTKYKKEITNYCSLYNETYRNDYDEYVHEEACKIISENMRFFIKEKNYNIEIKPKEFNNDLLSVKTYTNNYDIYINSF